MENVIERDSHVLLIGRIRAARTIPQGDPLLSWRGGYRSLVGAGDDWAPLIESYRL
ncbi:flavin reductase (DIM6/NTAB) family NADH-FMN oxidoreductase RutF [Angulomicrobium tetraedrale]|uniref:Flavin reductase (DIM6/NTAB) family NADH-FMN oxidoreductase RutF n=1 Tax=Ancylobacter tetraedralis TaxID=217068 RepID=A0A839Z6M7_9HYPH|nr:flavin reductase family protein [Ancylobacter tetraedralis]MBB3770016.1 flavin reductase (DIM6/NTAB) family NADH-FMN oxidoreductase RutF [Ancylobacter tetraedralis]